MSVTVTVSIKSEVLLSTGLVMWCCALQTTKLTRVALRCFGGLVGIRPSRSS